MSQNRSALNLLFYLICFAIVYGSLFPFQFSLDLDKEVFNQFIASWKIVPSRGDILGNIALFIPFGLVAYFLSAQSGRYHNRAAFLLVIWLVVAAGSQVAQFIVPSRNPSIFDLYGNAFGAILGWVVGRLLPREVVSGLAGVNAVRQIPSILALLWLASELIPFVPTIDFQAYKNAVKPLFLAPEWSWYECLLQANSWVVFLYLLQHVAGLDLRLWRLLPGILGVLFLKIIIVENNVSLTDALAIVSALAVWISLRGRRPRADLLGWSLLASFSINALFPFTFRAETAVFAWVPFSGFLQGSMLVNSTVLCQKLFFFGSMVFLIQQDKRNWKKISLLIASVILVLEVVQIWIASGTPELTDPLLFLAIAWLYFTVGDTTERVSESHMTKFGVGAIAGDRANTSLGLTTAAELLRQYSPKSQITGAAPPMRNVAVAVNNKKSVAIVVGVYCALVVIFLKLVLGADGVPYNVKELFGGRGDGFDFLFFSLSLLSIGWGSAWLGRVFASTRRPAMDVPIALLKLILVIYLFLWLSVTGESIRDIVGSNVFVRNLSEGAVLGEFGVHVVRFFGADNLRMVIGAFEPIVRFGALIGPLLVFAGLCLAIMQRGAGTFPHIQNSNKEFGVACMWLLPWLYLCKVIAFDLPATDNLYELIARDGPWGIGGGGYLYLLVLLLTSLSSFVTWAYFRKSRALVIALIVVLGSLPVSWLLLNQGLEQNIVKYNRHFSGVNFLLGPDRRNLISQSELFFRWSFIQMVFVVGMAFGAILYLRWVGQGAPAKSTGNIAVVPLRFRVYRDQWEFLHNLADATNTSMDGLVHSIIRYFGHEMAISSDDKNVLENYIESSKATSRRVFAPAEIEVKLTSEEFDILSSVNSNNAHSESRIFRKLLEIFMVASEEQTAKL